MFFTRRAAQLSQSLDIDKSGAQAILPHNFMDFTNGGFQDTRRDRSLYRF